MPICATQHAKYDDCELPIAPGAVLVLYTDGLIERRHEPLDTGLERLAAAVAGGPDDVERLADDVIEALVPPTAPATDDVALLVVDFEADRSRFSMRVMARPRRARTAATRGSARGQPAWVRTGPNATTSCSR